MIARVCRLHTDQFHKAVFDDKLIFLTSKIAAATVLLLLAGTSTATSCNRSYDANNIPYADNIDCGDTSFCGYDNECHEFSRQAFFSYGPGMSTGNSNGDMVLVCNPYVSSVDNYPDPEIYSGFKQLGVRYSCGDSFSDRDVFIPYNEPMLN